MSLQSVGSVPFAGGARSSGFLSVSVVIPVRNEEAVIGQCLEALTTIDFPAERLDVVVVDNGSVDRTLDIVQSFAKRLNLTILQRPGVRISALRNAGASFARGDILAFLDADCLPKTDWLRSALRVISERGRVVVGSDYLIPPGSTWVARAWYGSEPLPEMTSVSYVPSGDLLISRAVFNEIGGFNESIQTNEDCEFCLRARMAGFPVYACAALAVVHLGTPQTVARFFRKQRWHGTHVFHVFRQNVRALQNAKPIAFAVYTVLALAGLVYGSLVAFTSGNLAPLAISAGTLVVLPLLLASAKGISRRKPSQILPLCFLFLLYGIARAVSLMNPRNW